MKFPPFMNNFYNLINEKLSTTKLIAIACGLSFIIVFVAVTVSIQTKRPDEDTPIIAINKTMSNVAEDNYIKVTSDIKNLIFANDYYSKTSKVKNTEEKNRSKNTNQNDISNYIYSTPIASKANYEIIKNINPTKNFAISKPDSMPVLGNISSRFGRRKDPIDGDKDFHNGIDIAATEGSIIRASGAGIVTFSGKNGNYGNMIIISHGYGYRSLYAHNSKNIVKVGDKVKKGDKIAYIGNTGKSTGPHLHFEIHYKGRQINPELILD